MPKVQAANGAMSPGSGRGARGHRVSTSLAEINVVPLVDVMLVLLIIFMVTAPMIQRGIDVNLPVARRAQQIAAERIEVTVPLSYRTDKKLFLGAEAMDGVRLQELVRQRIEHAAALRNLVCINPFAG